MKLKYSENLRQFILLLFLFILFSPGQINAKEKNEHTPWSFSVKTFDGKVIPLPHRHGKVTVYVFQAFWCDTWREVAEGYKALKNDLNEIPCDFYAICTDSAIPDEKLTKEAALTTGYPIFFDHTGELTEYFRIKAVPTFLIFDKKNQQVYRYEGYPGNKILKKMLIKLNGYNNNQEDKVDTTGQTGTGLSKTKKPAR